MVGSDSGFAKKNARSVARLQHACKNLQKYEDCITILSCLLLGGGLFLLSSKVFELVGIGTNSLSLVPTWDSFVIQRFDEMIFEPLPERRWPFDSFQLTMLQWNNSLTSPGLLIGGILYNVCLRIFCRVLLQDLAADLVTKNPRLRRNLQYACEGLQRYGRFATIIASLFVAYLLPFVFNNILDVADVAKDVIAYTMPNEEDAQKSKEMFFKHFK
jgi:hypothetical protein